MADLSAGGKASRGQQLPQDDCICARELTRSSMTSLSMPRGPRVDRTASTTAMHALMLLISCGLPWLVSVPSRNRIICGCCTIAQER